MDLEERKSLVSPNQSESTPDGEDLPETIQSFDEMAFFNAHAEKAKEKRQLLNLGLKQPGRNNRSGHASYNHRKHYK